MLFYILFGGLLLLLLFGGSSPGPLSGSLSGGPLLFGLSSSSESPFGLGKKILSFFWISGYGSTVYGSIIYSLGISSFGISLSSSSISWTVLLYKSSINYYAEFYCVGGYALFHTSNTDYATCDYSYYYYCYY